MTFYQLIAQLSEGRDRSWAARVTRLILALIALTGLLLVSGVPWWAVILADVVLTGLFMLLLWFGLWINPNANAPPD